MKQRFRYFDSFKTEKCSVEVYFGSYRDPILASVVEIRRKDWKAGVFKIAYRQASPGITTFRYPRYP